VAAEVALMSTSPTPSSSPDPNNNITQNSGLGGDEHTGRPQPDHYTAHELPSSLLMGMLLMHISDLPTLQRCQRLRGGVNLMK